MRRALFAASVILFGAMFAPPAHALPTPEVVMIVPGQAYRAMPYTPLAAYLRAQGYITYLVDRPGYDMNADSIYIANAVNKARADHPGSSISIVSHSIGGTSARDYMKNHRGSAVIDKYIAIGTAQYGTPAACANNFAVQACPDSEFMKSLNDGDDTPGDTTYYSIRNELEWSDGRLDGGQCRMLPIAPFPDGDGSLEHSLEPFDPRVWESVRTALTGHCNGEFVTDPDGSYTAEDTLRIPEGS